MEIKKRKLKIKFEGEEYELAFPTLAMIKEYQNKSSDKKSALGVIEDGQLLLDRLGLPMSVTDQMEADNLTEIVSILSGQKKIQA